MTFICKISVQISIAHNQVHISGFPQQLKLWFIAASKCWIKILGFTFCVTILNTIQFTSIESFHLPNKTNIPDEAAVRISSSSLSWRQPPWCLLS